MASLLACLLCAALQLQVGSAALAQLRVLPSTNGALVVGHRLPVKYVAAKTEQRGRFGQGLPLSSRRHLQQRSAEAGEAAPPEASEAAPPKSYSVGGGRTQASLTALVAGISVGLLCSLGQYTQKTFGLPLWAPPLGAVSLIFASEATAAAQKGEIASPGALFQRSLKTGSAVVGACLLTVFISKHFGATPLARAAAVIVCSLYMSAMPLSGYFPPCGAFCVLFVDQAIAHGAFERLGYMYSIFPSGVGTVLLVLLTRIVAGFIATPLRAVQKSKA